MILPTEAQTLLCALGSAFTGPTFDRFISLMTPAKILTTSRRTIANLFRTLAPLTTIPFPSSICTWMVPDTLSLAGLRACVRTHPVSR
jgi:hypothetical protein